ncbi:uncharacterized protein LOC112568564 isoform X2 [Pomacea canaliculata]|uniref:uncharacterized protein LOC112568564 isoform X2 n=1 Tax=Pomacea canaliculata TaxID=400727 RepID=UPI000D734648|nr:uncharacterized protein LOC112568564 isoform X2 [Pomacea canaliculata]
MTITCDIKSSLHCTSTSAIQGLSLYFKPDVGDERRVFMCASLSDNECNNYNGVTCRLLSPTHVEIILSEHQHENGTYRCVMRGMQLSETQRCRWTPGAESHDGTSTVNTYISRITELSYDEATTFIPEPENKDYSTEQITGAVLGSLLFIIFIMVVGYVIWRFLKSKRSSEVPETCSMDAQNSGLCKWSILTHNSSNSQTNVGEDAKQTPLLSSNMPNREEGVSNTEDNKNESTSVKINIQDLMRKCSLKIKQ